VRTWCSMMMDSNQEQAGRFHCGLCRKKFLYVPDKATGWVKCPFCARILVYRDSKEPADWRELLAEILARAKDRRLQGQSLEALA